MTIAQVPLICDELLDYLAHRATPEEILAFKVSRQAEERLELDQISYFDGKISILKAKIALQK
jgi:hypothetical protein